MNPWLSEQLATARTEDWLRAAEGRRRAASGRTDRPGHARILTLQTARAHVGSALIRAGRRIGGPTVLVRARPAC